MKIDPKCVGCIYFEMTEYECYFNWDDEKMLINSKDCVKNEVTINTSYCIVNKTFQESEKDDIIITVSDIL